MASKGKRMTVWTVRCTRGKNVISTPPRISPVGARRFKEAAQKGGFKCRMKKVRMRKGTVRRLRPDMRWPRDPNSFY